MKALIASPKIGIKSKTTETPINKSKNLDVLLLSKLYKSEVHFSDKYFNKIKKHWTLSKSPFLKYEVGAELTKKNFKEKKIVFIRFWKRTFDHPLILTDRNFGMKRILKQNNLCTTRAW